MSGRPAANVPACGTTHVPVRRSASHLVNEAARAPHPRQAATARRSCTRASSRSPAVSHFLRLCRFTTSSVRSPPRMREGRRQALRARRSRATGHERRSTRGACLDDTSRPIASTRAHLAPVGRATVTARPSHAYGRAHATRSTSARAVTPSTPATTCRCCSCPATTSTRPRAPRTPRSRSLDAGADISRGALSSNALNLDDVGRRAARSRDCSSSPWGDRRADRVARCARRVASGRVGRRASHRHDPTLPRCLVGERPTAPAVGPRGARVASRRGLRS
jgi:hypothetical protein